MDETQISSLQTMLQSRESAMLAKLARDDESDTEFATLQAQHFSESSSDNALVYTLNDLSSEAAQHDTAELVAVRHALKKFDAGSYGLCESCGEIISFLRLNVRPEARYCITCQEKSEKKW